MQQRVVERRMDVLRGQADHLRRVLRGKPDGIPFVPPERLETQV